MGKSVEDARDGGSSGCVEVGAFGKEAFILAGYFNIPKMLELALHDGVDPRTGRQLGPRTGDPASFATFDDLFAAFLAQMRHFVEIKVRGNSVIERLYATYMPAPFLSTADRRLHRQGPRLSRRRPALRHHLHPGGRHRHDHRRAVGDQASRLRPARPDDGRAAGRAGRGFRRATSGSANCCSTAPRATATTTTRPMRSWCASSTRSST